MQGMGVATAMLLASLNQGVEVYQLGDPYGWSTWSVDATTHIIGPHRLDERAEPVAATMLLHREIHDAARCGAGWVFAFDEVVGFADTFTGDVRVVAKDLGRDARVYPVGDHLRVIDEWGQGYAGLCGAPVHPVNAVPGQPLQVFGGDEERWLAVVGPGWLLESTDHGVSWEPATPGTRPPAWKATPIAQFRPTPWTDRRTELTPALDRLARHSPAGRLNLLIGNHETERTGRTHGYFHPYDRRQSARISQRGFQWVDRVVGQCDGPPWSPAFIPPTAIPEVRCLSLVEDCGERLAVRDDLCGHGSIVVRGAPHPPPGGSRTTVVQLGNVVGVWRPHKPRVAPLLRFEHAGAAEQALRRIQVFDQGLVSGWTVDADGDLLPFTAAPPNYKMRTLKLPEPRAHFGMLGNAKLAVAVGSHASEMWLRPVPRGRWTRIAGLTDTPLERIGLQKGGPWSHLLSCDGWGCRVPEVNLWIEPSHGRHAPHYPRKPAFPRAPERPASLVFACTRGERRFEKRRSRLATRTTDAGIQWLWHKQSDEGPYESATAVIPLQVGQRGCQHVASTRDWALLSCIGLDDTGEPLHWSKDQRDFQLVRVWRDSSQFRSLPVPPGRVRDHVVLSDDQVAVILEKRDGPGHAAALVNGRDEISQLVQLQGRRETWRFQRRDPALTLVAEDRQPGTRIDALRRYRFSPALRGIKAPPPAVIAACNEDAGGPLTPMSASYFLHERKKWLDEIAWIQHFGSDEACILRISSPHQERWLNPSNGGFAGTIDAGSKFWHVTCELVDSSSWPQR